MTGNCLRGSRGLVVFDGAWDQGDEEWKGLMKEMLTHVSVAIHYCLSGDRWNASWHVASEQGRQIRSSIEVQILEDTWPSLHRGQSDSAAQRRQRCIDKDRHLLNLRSLASTWPQPGSPSERSSAVARANEFPLCRTQRIIPSMRPLLINPDLLRPRHLPPPETLHRPHPPLLPARQQDLVPQFPNRRQRPAQTDRDRALARRDWSSIRFDPY